MERSSLLLDNLIFLLPLVSSQKCAGVPILFLGIENRGSNGGSLGSLILIGDNEYSHHGTEKIILLTDELDNLSITFRKV